MPGILIPLFQPSSVHPLMSIPRFGLVLFPLFIVMAILFRKRIVYLPLAVISTLLLDLAYVAILELVLGVIGEVGCSRKRGFHCGR